MPNPSFSVPFGNRSSGFSGADKEDRNIFGVLKLPAITAGGETRMKGERYRNYSSLVIGICILRELNTRVVACESKGCQE